MAKDALNYEAKAVCNNGAECDFQFHGDNAELAKAHAKSMADSSLDFFDFNKQPDQIRHVYYRKIGNQNWKYVRPYALS